MSRITDSGFPVQDSTGSSQSGTKQHFDTFETQFFQQGDDGAGTAAEVERFDDLDDGSRRRKFAPSRQFVMSVAIGSACLAIIGCVALWRSSSHSNSPAAAATAVAPLPSAQAEPVPGIPAPVAVTAQAEPRPAPAPARPMVAVAEAQANPAPSPALPSAAPVPVQPAPLVAVAEQPTPARAAGDGVKPALAAEAMPVPQSPAAAASAADAHDRCKKAVSDRHNKEILAACAEAFAADPSAADIAVALAKTEFDRGRTAQALVWGKKAIIADPNTADAYVFVGGAEQSAGHGKAAKEAYRRYLQLAPSGRYASDLRAIVGSL